MKPIFRGLDTETQLLMAIGSAVAAGCIPCLENIAAMAKAEGVDAKKMKAAADRLLGTHLGSAPATEKSMEPA